MTRLRVLVTGGQGQIGTEVAAAFTGTAREVVAPSSAQLDVTDRDAVLQAVGGLRPQVVVHTAAWTAVDACEHDPDRAMAVNALGTRHVAEACRRFDAHLLHLSTDYVFDGRATAPYDEWAPTNPLSVYGRSKLAAEMEATAAVPGATVVRTSGVVGRHGHNFVKTMLRLAAEGDQVQVVTDQRCSPTDAAQLAAAIVRLAVDRRPGVHHVTLQGDTTWCELAREVFRLAGHDPTRVLPVTTVDYGAPAPRPAYSVLDNAVLRLQGLPLLPPWQESIERLVKELTQ